MWAFAVALLLAWAPVCRAQDAAPGWEKDFADARSSWKILPAPLWRAAPERAAPGGTHVLEDDQAGRWSVRDNALALAGRWIVVDETMRHESLISLGFAPDGADLVVRAGVWGPPVIKRDSDNFSFEDRAGPEARVAPVARVTHYFRIRAAELLDAEPWSALADVAWLAVALDERRDDPFISAIIRIDPARGLSGRAVAMALTALSRGNLVALDSPLRDPHLGDVAADWVDARLQHLPPSDRREVQMAYDEHGRLMFTLVDHEKKGLVARAAISLPRLQERL